MMYGWCQYPWGTNEFGYYFTGLGGNRFSKVTQLNIDWHQVYDQNGDPVFIWDPGSQAWVPLLEYGGDYKVAIYNCLSCGLTTTYYTSTDYPTSLQEATQGECVLEINGSLETCPECVAYS